MTDLETRIADCRRRWAGAPRSRAFIPLADLLRQDGRCEEALSVLEEGLARHPHAVGGLVTLARTLAAAGKPTQAAEVVGRVLEHDPDNLVALELLAEEDRRRGDLVAAIGHYERLAQLEPGDRHWPAVLGQLRDLRTEAAAAAGGDADAGFATLTLVDLYLAQGYREKAVGTLRRLAADRPEDPVVGRRLAALCGPGGGPHGLPGSADQGDASVLQDASGPGTAAERRELAREQFTRWLDRIRTEREVAP